jgi:hypothetical protein
MERIGERALLQMLRKLAADLALSAGTADPALTGVEPFDRWLTWAEAEAESGTGADGDR